MTFMAGHFRKTTGRYFGRMPRWSRNPRVLTAVGIATLLTVILLFHTRRLERIGTLDELYRYADQGWIRRVRLDSDRIEGEFNEAAIVARGLGSSTRFRLVRGIEGTNEEVIRRMEQAGVEVIKPKIPDGSAVRWIVPMVIGITAAFLWIFRREWIAIFRRSGGAHSY